MKPLSPIFHIFTVFLAITASANQKPAISKSLHGMWTAYSKNHMAISGNMVISDKTIKFAKAGEVEYEVIHHTGDEYILKLSINVDDGLFMRLGPSKIIDTDEEMEVAYYDSIEDAVAARVDRIGKANSWGIYSRTARGTQNAPASPASP